MAKTKCDAVKRCDHILVYGSITKGNAVKSFNCILMNVLFMLHQHCKLTKG